MWVGGSGQHVGARWRLCGPVVVFFFFQAEDGIREKATWLEFRRVLFRSRTLASPSSTSNIASVSTSGWRCPRRRSEEHTSELQSRGLISYAVFCLKKQ